MGATEDADSAIASPVRGEIWDVDLEPAEPGELDKTRPVLVINAMPFDRLDTRVVVPLTTWRSGFEQHANKVFVRATRRNGLGSDSAADAAQVRAVSLYRFTRRRGTINPNLLEEIVAAVAVVIGYRP